MITKEIATSLKLGAILVHATMKNTDKTPTRCRVNRRCKVDTKHPDYFCLPVKHGLKHCFYITPKNANDWNTTL